MIATTTTTTTVSTTTASTTIQRTIFTEKGQRQRLLTKKLNLLTS
jgi:hypothetical protein